MVHGNLIFCSYLSIVHMPEVGIEVSVVVEAPDWHGHLEQALWPALRGNPPFLGTLRLQQLAQFLEETEMLSGLIIK